MQNEIQLFKGEKTIKRIAKKGGWTYLEIDEIDKNKYSKNGRIKIKGTIDDCKIYALHLLPIKNGGFMLTLNLFVRKQIKKQVGEEVFVEIYLDQDEVPIPDELLICLEAEPEAYEYYKTLNDSIKRNIIQYTYQASKYETKVKRITMFMARLRQKDIHNYSIKE